MQFCILRRMRCRAAMGRPGRASLLHLPERIAPMLDFAERVERADAGQQRQVLCG